MLPQRLFCPVDGRMVLRVQGWSALAVYDTTISTSFKLERNKANFLHMLPIGSQTRWFGHSFNILPFTAMKIWPIAVENCQSSLKILHKDFKKIQKRGKKSPNLVTLRYISCFILPKFSVLGTVGSYVGSNICIILVEKRYREAYCQRPN